MKSSKTQFSNNIFCGFVALSRKWQECRFTNVHQDDTVSSRGVSSEQQPYLRQDNLKHQNFFNFKNQKMKTNKGAKFEMEHKQTFVPIQKKSLQSIPEIGC